jgi:cell wall assembly regulator SMI1
MTLTLDQVRAAMESCLNGPPTATVVLRHKGKTAAAAHVPSEVDVLIRAIDDEESWAYLGTAGMSLVAMKGPIERAELMMRVDGKHRKKDLEQLARRLGDVVAEPFRKGFALRDEMILDDVNLPLYAGMPSVAITRWSGEPDELPGVDPPVRLLEVTPLYPREAEIVRKIGVAEAFRRFSAEGVNTWDPSRDEASLEASDDESPYDPDLEVRPIDEIIDGLEAWLEANAPKIHAELRPGVSEARLKQFEATIGEPCPADLRAWFARHDGAPTLGSYRCLPIDGVEATWRGWNEMVDDGTFTDGRTPEDESGGIFQAVWWHRGWLPFGEDGSGNNVCVDVAPGPRGVRGQVIFWESQSGPQASSLPSFAAWLDAFVVGLEEGAYVVDDEGFIERRR